MFFLKGIPMAAPVRPHTRWTLSLAFGLIGALVVGVVVLAFLWPTKTASAHDLPIGISGPDAAVTAIEDAVAARGDSITFVASTDREDAAHQIETRATYGAIVLSATDAPEVLTAPAAGAVPTQLLTGLAAQLQAQLSQQAHAAGAPTVPQVAVTAVVPLSDSDPSGTGLAAAAFPLTLGGMLGGVLISLLVVGPLRRLTALLAYGVGVGLLLAVVLQTWFGYLQGDFLLNAAAIALVIAATSAFVVGCASLFGPAGIGIGAVVTILFANPISGATMPWQFLVAPWGAIGQYLVPGAASWLLRGLSYFPDADATAQWLVLGGWVVLGVVLTVAGHFRSRPGMHVPAATLEPAA